MSQSKTPSLIERLRARGAFHWNGGKDDKITCGVLHEAAAELTRLSAEKAEVERERDVYAELAANKCVIQKVTDTLGQMTLCTVAEYRSFKTRAEAAESALLQAREDALEEAAKVCERALIKYAELHGYGADWDGCKIMSDDCAAAIRALKSARQAEPQENKP
jgi:hypothetical protein